MRLEPGLVSAANAMSLKEYAQVFSKHEEACKLSSQLCAN